MKSSSAGLAAVLCAVLLFPAVLGDEVTFDYTWEEEGSTVLLSDGAVVTAPQVSRFDDTGFRTFGVQTGGRPVDTITFDDDFSPGTNSGFEFSLQQLPYGDDMMSQLPAGINEDYLLSDLLIVSIRADIGLPFAQTTYRVTSNRVRDPDAQLPIPAVAEETFGKLTYETGERRDYVDAPVGCPAGFEYRVVNVDLPLSSEATCGCPASCTSTVATCSLSGPGRYAISVVPDWLCGSDTATPVPRNEDDPLDEKAAIAAGTILSVLFFCCLLFSCMLCINAGPKDDHWHHAPRVPGAIPLPPDWKEEDPEQPLVDLPNPDAPKPPPRLLPDGNPHAYNIGGTAPAMPPGPGDAPRLMADPRRPAPPLASPPLPDPF